jgi:hypothetical protein
MKIKRLLSVLLIERIYISKHFLWQGNRIR